MVPTVGPRILTVVKNKLLWYLLWVIEGLLWVENKLLWYLLWVIEGLMWVENKLLWYLLWVLEYLLRWRISYCGAYCRS